MLATLSRKGQVTLPKAIRDRLSLEAGSYLDLQLQADNTITMRLIKPDALRVRGLLKSTQPRVLSPAQEAQAVADHLNARQTQRARKSKSAQW